MDEGRAGGRLNYSDAALSLSLSLTHGDEGRAFDRRQSLGVAGISARRDTIRRETRTISMINIDNHGPQRQTKRGLRVCIMRRVRVFPVARLRI